MILRFRVSNFRSIRDEVEISLVAKSSSTGDAAQLSLEGLQRAFPDAVRVAAIFGANASGKSNILRAVEFMQTAVTQSHASWTPAQPIPRTPFCLDEQSQMRPTLMELDFLLDGIRHQYGFEVDDARVVREWLYTYPTGRRRTLFERLLGDYSFGKTLAGENRLIATITRPNSLFLSAAATANHETLLPVFLWFGRAVRVVNTRSPMNAAAPLTVELLRDDRSRELIHHLLSMADLGVLSAKVEKRPMEPDMLRRMQRILRAAVDPETENPDAVVEGQLASLNSLQETVSLAHASADGSTYIPFHEESLGTQMWFSFIGYLVVAIRTGGVLIVDELNASMHPILVAEAIELFQDLRLNRTGAQLIFTSHDTTPLGKLAGRLPLRRDAVWLVDKSPEGSSTLTPLTDFRPRTGENLQLGYLQGRYGAVPRAAWFDLLLSDLTALDLVNE